MRAALEALLKRRQLAVGVALVVMVVAVGLTLGHPRAAAPGGPHATAVAGQASLSGAVEGCRGAAPRGCRVMSIGICAPNCLTTRWVVVRDAAGDRIAKARVRHGRFSIALAPGEYQLDLLATGPGGRSRVFQSQRVSLRRDAIQHVSFKLSIQ